MAANQHARVFSFGDRVSGQGLYGCLTGQRAIADIAGPQARTEPGTGRRVDDTYQVMVADERGARTMALGPTIDPKRLRLRNGIVTWWEDGRQRSTRLPR